MEKSNINSISTQSPPSLSSVGDSKPASSLSSSVSTNVSAGSVSTTFSFGAKSKPDESEAKKVKDAKLALFSSFSSKP